MRKTLCLTLSLLLAAGNSSIAFPPEEIATSNSIRGQSIQSREPALPYMISGESLTGMLEEIVTFDTPGSSIVFNRRTAQLFVKTTPTNHEVVEKIIDELRNVDKRQVEIEARIITVSSTDFEGIGVDSATWNFLSKNNVNDLNNDTIFGGGTVNGTSLTSDTPNINFPDLNSIFSTSGIGGAFSLGIAQTDDFDIDLLIDLLARTADVNTLAAPRLTVFNNQRANIAIKKHKFFISEIETEFEARGVDTNNIFTAVQDPTISIADSGTILDVTPTINSNGSITLELQPSFVTVDLSNTQEIENGSGASNDSVTLPIYDLQEINTTVTVSNGGVVTLGGLISEEEINEYDKVPFFGDIPLVGKFLFQSNQKRDVKKHLLIFVKASVRSPRLV